MSAVHLCPQCKRAVPRPDELRPPSFPFCSDRCRLQDLGKWFSGDYVIPAPISPDDDEAIAAIEQASRGEA